MHRTSISRNNPGAVVEKLNLPRRTQSHSHKRHGTLVTSARVAAGPPPAAELRVAKVAAT